MKQLLTGLVFLFTVNLVNAQFTTLEIAGGPSSIDEFGSNSHLQVSLRYDPAVDFMISFSWLEWKDREAEIKKSIQADEIYMGNRGYTMQFFYHDKFNRFSGYFSGGGIALMEMKKSDSNLNLKTSLQPGVVLGGNVYISAVSRLYLTIGASTILPINYKNVLITTPKWYFLSAGLGWLVY